MPRTMSGAFSTYATLQLEAVVQARAHDVGREVRASNAADRAALAEIDIEILNLRGPRTGDCSFDAAADRPTGLGLVAVADARDRGVDIADGETAGDVRHPTAGVVTEAATNRTEPVVFRADTCSSVAVTQSAPADIA